jgi:uncharacterized membrane protein
VTLGRLARSRIARLGLAGWIMGVGALLAAAPVSLAANPVTLTTPYPAIEVAPGAKVNLTVSIGTASAGRVDLTISDVPTDWTATIRGGGFLVNSVQSDGTKATDVTLDIAVPESAASGNQRITLHATRGQGLVRRELQLQPHP